MLVSDVVPMVQANPLPLPSTGMCGVGDMVQVRPTLIPSASPIPNEYVPINLPQIMMANGKQFIKEPAPSVNISPGGSINISSGGQFNVGSTMHPYKSGMSGLGENKSPRFLAAALLGLFLYSAYKRR